MSHETMEVQQALYVVRGSITFGLPGEGQQVTLQARDRLELPRGTEHGATVGPEVVVCLEAPRR